MAIFVNQYQIGIKERAGSYTPAVLPSGRLVIRGEEGSMQYRNHSGLFAEARCCLRVRISEFRLAKPLLSHQQRHTVDSQQCKRKGIFRKVLRSVSSKE